MSRESKAKRPRKKPKDMSSHYLLRLFIVGDGHNSRLALANLRDICEQHLKGRHTIETVDVVKNFKAAIQNNILVTPALVVVAPLPTVVVLGNLSDRPKVLLALRLPGGGEA